MEHHATFCKNNIRYAKITLKKRKQLVKEVLQKNQLISKTAKKLNLKLSTAKLIIKRYKEEGTFFQSKAERSKRLEKEVKAIVKASDEQGRSPIKQKLQHPLTENYSYINSNVINTHQLFYFDHNWMQPFPLVFPAFQAMMFYPL